MRHDADDRIERLIDRAASSLTDAATSPAFTAKLMAAIDETPHRAPVSWGPRLAPVAACAVLLLALAGWWQQRRHEAPGHGDAPLHALEARRLPTNLVSLPPGRTAFVPLGGGDREPAAHAAARRWAAGAAATPRLPTYDPIAIDGLEIAPAGTGDSPVTLDPVPAPDPIEVDELAIEPIDLSRQPRSEPPQSPGGRR